MHPPKPPDVDGCVDYCLALMDDAAWRRGKTDRELAAAWGVSRVTIHDYSSQASRIQYDRLRDRQPELAERALVAITSVMERGAAGEKAGDLSAAVQASKTALEFAGLDRPTDDGAAAVTVVLKVGERYTSPAMAMLTGRQMAELTEGEVVADAPV